jgi:predicted alpha/beta superfamily hydrolase
MNSEPPLHTIPRTEVHHLRSPITDQTYRISVALPRGYGNGSVNHPVLYALDADIGFGTLVEAQRLMSIRQEVADILIVGIGYWVDDFAQSLNVRRRDLTPTIDKKRLESLLAEDMNETSPALMGGGPDFYRFIEQELMPFIEGRYAVDKHGRGILGVSLGGLFAACCLFQHTNAFQHYIICSPSLWWDEGVIFTYERAYADKSRDLEANIFLSVGELEDEEMVEAVKQLGTILRERRYNGLHLTAKIFAEETHRSATGVAAWRGLREIYGKD